MMQNARSKVRIYEARKQNVAKRKNRKPKQQLKRTVFIPKKNHTSQAWDVEGRDYIYTLSYNHVSVVVRQLEQRSTVVVLNLASRYKP